MKRLIPFLWLAVLLWPVFSQEQAEQRLFDAGVAAYKSGNYESAQQSFLELLQKYPNGALITGIRLMLAKSYYKLSNYANAEVVCKYFFTRHPESSYIDDMHHLLGNTLYRLRKYNEAVEEWIWVIQNSRDPRLKQTSSEYLYRTMDNYLSEQEVQALQMRHSDPQVNGTIKLVLARKMIEKNRDAEGKALLQALLREQPDHIFADEARRLLGSDPVSSTGTGNVTTTTGSSAGGNSILYLKPAEGETREASDAIQLGMEYALREYQRRSADNPIRLNTREVEATVASALSVVAEETANSRPLCLVGPINPDQNAGIALFSRYEDQPYVVPLSSQHGLTELSPYTFQINPDTRTKGHFLGQYAAGDLKLKNLAVLAPVNEYGQNLVQSFIETAQANGSKVATVQWYYETAQDFTRQFRAIWREGLYLAYRDSVLGADSTVSEGRIKSGYRSYLHNLFEPRRVGVSVDSTDVPATGIDGLLIVIRSNEFIQYFATQLAFNNIRTTLLGNEGWNDPNLLRKYRTHLEGLIYVTAGYFDPESPNYKVFMNRFRNELQTTPEQFHLLGYDIMKWILSNYSPGISPPQLRDNMARSGLYEGILTDIKFSADAPRVNSMLTVLKLNLGQIIRLNK